MAYLHEFYKAAQEHGFSKDYQLKLTDLKINLKDFVKDYPYIPYYIKKIPLPVTKATAVKDLSLYNKTIPIVGSTPDFVDKTGFAVTFWLPSQAFPFLDALNNAIDESAAPTTADTGRIMKLSLINDENVTIAKITLTSLGIRSINTVNYNVDGPGRPQEITVNFSFFDARYEKLSPENYENLIYTFQKFGSTDDGRPDSIDYSVSRQVPRATETITNAEPKKTLSQTLANITQGIQAIGGAAQAIRRTSRVIRGR